jgi:hypothetical protein
MTWNYRVVVFLVDPITGLDLETPRHSIHEVYYDQNGRPHAYIASPATIGWDADDPYAPDWILERLREAVLKPALDARLFES